MHRSPHCISLLAVVNVGIMVVISASPTYFYVRQGAVEAAFEDGLSLVEVEFPPLQQDYLEDSGSSAYEVSSANVRLASRFAQSFAAEGKVSAFVSSARLCASLTVRLLCLVLDNTNTVGFPVKRKSEG